MKQTIEIKQYLKKVKLSNRRKTKYYELGKTLPKAKKYQDRSKYVYQKVSGFGYRQFLVEALTGLRVIANPKAAGTPKYAQINGQKIYNGEISKHSRNKIMIELAKVISPYVKTLVPVKQYPILINLQVHDTVREPSVTGALWDLDNRMGPYLKCFQDCLTKESIIKDDNSVCLCKLVIEYFPVSTEAERKLVFILDDVKDASIINQPDFKKELKEWNTKNI
jgi:Holliday junction resolvase RusA-like endonuclease